MAGLALRWILFFVSVRRLAVLQFQLPPRLQAGAFTISYHGGDTSGLDVELDRSFELPGLTIEQESQKSGPAESSFDRPEYYQSNAIFCRRNGLSR